MSEASFHSIFQSTTAFLFLFACLLLTDWWNRKVIRLCIASSHGSLPVNGIDKVLKCFVNVFSCDRAYLKKGKLVLMRKLLDLLLWDLSSVLKVTFSADNDDGDVLFWVFFNLRQPSAHFVKACLTCYVVAQYYSVGLPVEGGSECAESLLPSCVPNSNVDFFAEVRARSHLLGEVFQAYSRLIVLQIVLFVIEASY